jgi:hypothetical protein
MGRFEKEIPGAHDDRKKRMDVSGDGPFCVANRVRPKCCCAFGENK